MSLTLRNLQSGTERVRRLGNKDVSPIAVKLTKVNLSIPNKTLLIQATVTGSSGRSRYETDIEFQNVSVNPADTIGTTIVVPLNGSMDVHIQQAKQNMTMVKVACSCPDYTYTFAHLNASQGAHFGSLPTITRKTTTHKPRNSKQAPGMCKHIDALIDVLIQEKYLI